MNDSQRLTNHTVSPSVVFVLCILIVSIWLLPTSVLSETTDHRRQNHFKVWVQGGFFTPARSKMRSIYGNAVNMTAGAEVRISSRVFLGANGGYLEQTSDNVSLKYRNFYIVPAATISLIEGVRLNLYGQLGVGLNFRSVNSTSWFYKQNDFGLSGNAAIGIDYSLSGPFVVGCKTTFDYIFDSDPILGNFGNTGGWNFQVTGGVLF